MKIDELQRICTLKPPGATEPEEEFEGTDEEYDQLSAILSQLENCWSLIDALSEHFKNPKAKMTAYFRRELARVSTDSANTLLEYNMSGEEETS